MKVIRRLSSGTLLMLIVLTLVLAVSSVLESVLIKYLPMPLSRAIVSFFS